MLKALIFTLVSPFICYLHPYFTHPSTLFCFSGSCKFLKHRNELTLWLKGIPFYRCFTTTRVFHLHCCAHLFSIWGMQSKHLLSHALPSIFPSQALSLTILPIINLKALRSFLHLMICDIWETAGSLFHAALAITEQPPGASLSAE